MLDYWSRKRLLFRLRRMGGRWVKSPLSSLRLRKLDPSPVPEGPGEIRLFTTMRNEALRLPWFFEHHRNIGVDRFFIVDNGSEDATQALLLAQPSTHVYSTRESFGRSHFGHTWRQVLMRRHGRGHWCLLLDADELFIFPLWDHGTLDLHDLCAFMDARSETVMRAPLLDMYSDRPLSETLYRAGQDPLEVCPFFDERSHYLDQGRLRGGPRERVFGTAAWLEKHNLFKMIDAQMPGPGAHWFDGRAPAAITGRTLHFKYLADFGERVAAEADREEHWRGGTSYKKYAATVSERTDVSLFYSGSVRLESSAQLIALGLMNCPEAFAELADEPPQTHRNRQTDQS